jgi:conjugal transfer pilus assembly protein TraK
MLVLALAIQAGSVAAQVPDIPIEVDAKVEEATDETRWERLGRIPDVQPEEVAGVDPEPALPGESAGVPEIESPNNSGFEIPQMPVSRPISSTAQVGEASQRGAPSASRGQRSAPIKPQALDSARNLVVEPGQNNIVPIASAPHINRIVTPFERPRVVYDHDTALIEADEQGRVVWASAARDDVVSLYITDADNPERGAISLTLAAGPVPPQEVNVSLSGEEAMGPAGRLAKEYENQSDHQTLIMDLLADVALGDIPQGYTLRNVAGREPIITCPGQRLSTRPAQVIEGHSLFVVVYEALNPSNRTISIDEADCYQEGVLALSFFPAPRIESGRSVELYAVFRRNSPQQEQRRRPSVIGGAD